MQNPACYNCGYQLDGLPDNNGAVQCPECGETTILGRLYPRSLPLNTWLLVLGAGALPLLVAQAVTLTGKDHAHQPPVLLFVCIFLIGPAIALIFAYASAFRHGLHRAYGRRTIRAEAVALLTTLDSLCFNVVLSGFIAMLLVLFAH